MHSYTITYETDDSINAAVAADVAALLDGDDFETWENHIRSIGTLLDIAVDAADDGRRELLRGELLRVVQLIHLKLGESQ